MNASPMEKLNKKLTSSVIICTKDREQDLMECVDSITAQTLLPEELVIVDAGRENGLEAKVEERLKKTSIQLRYIRTEPGLTRQRNLGVKHSCGDIVFFFDDDVVLYKDYLENIVQMYSSCQNENLGGVGGNIVNMKYSPWYWRVFNKVFLIYQHGSLLPAHTHFFDEVRQVKVLSGCNMSYKREVFKESEFDENVPGYALMEDVDFSFRVSQKYNLKVTPQAKVIHKQSPVSRDKISKYIQMQNYNSFYLFMKNCPKNPKNLVFFAWSRVGMFLNSLLHFLASRNVGWLTGFLKGQKLILEDVFMRKVIDKNGLVNLPTANDSKLIGKPIPVHTQQKVSVIIPTKNRKEDLFETLNSVFNQSVSPFEILIIDQSKERIDYTPMRHLAITKNIDFKVIYDPQIKGLTQARNIGIDSMRGDVVLFLDDDLTLDRNYVNNMLLTFSEPRCKDIAGVGGIVKLLHENKKLGFNHFFKLGPFSDTREKIKGRPPGIYESRYLSGGSMLLKREDIQGLRFDENMTGYSHGEDMDFCWRLSQKKKLVINSRATCVHKLSSIGREKGKRITNDILFHFYFLSINLPFTLENLAAYLWFNLGMLARPVFRFEPKMYKDVFRGYYKIWRFIFTKKLE
jgi:GT2 family glycosyltransferase